MRPVLQQYHGRGFRGTAPAVVNSKSPVFVSAEDPRLTPTAMALAVFSFLRAGVVLQPASSNPTSQVEYLLPDLVLQMPAPVLTVSWNRVMLYYTTNDVPQDGEFYVYRTGDPLEQRIRLGRAPDAGDIIRAELYVVDCTV